MSNRIVSLRAVAAVGLTLALAGCSGSAPSAAPSAAATAAATAAADTPAAGAITLRLSDDAAVDSPAYRNDEFFASEVERISGGTIQVEVFPAGQLYSETDILPALQRGEVDMGVVPDWSSVEPGVFILDLPFEFTSWDEFHAFLDGPGGKLLTDSFAEHGIHHLFYQDNSSIDLIGTRSKLVKVPEDLVGLRMRSFGVPASQAITLWGAAPTQISSGETYTAVQRGTVDGIFSGASFFIRKWYEVTPYITQVPVSYRANALQMSKAKWDVLSAEQQGFITQAAESALQANRAEMPGINVETYAQIADLAEEFYVATPEEIEQWRSSVSGMHEWYLEQSPELGQNVLDVLDD